MAGRRPIPATRAEPHTSRFTLSWLDVVIPSMSLETDMRWFRWRGKKEDIILPGTLFIE
jgi:hypothetical protein